VQWRDLAATHFRAVTASQISTDERLHHLVDAAVDYAIFLLDPSGKITTWSVGAQRLKGYEADQIIGQHFSVFYSAEDRAAGRPKQILETARRDGRYEEEGYRYRKDGTRFWANIVLTPLWDATGEIRGFAKVTRDLTERRAAAEALHESEERFRMLVQGVTDYAIYMIDPRGIVTTWNEGAQRMKGYRIGEIVGRSFEAFFPQVDIVAQKPERELAAALRDGRFEDEGWRVRKDGSRFWANVVITPLYAPDGKHLGFAKITRDLTEKRQAEAVERTLLHEQAARAAAEASRRQLLASEEAARSAAQRADESNRIKDEFLATVSHELRNPLNAIIGWSTILRDSSDASLQAKGLDAIHRNAMAQARLIDDVLDVSRIITGKLRLELKPINLGSIAADALDVVRPSADAKNIRISVQVDPELPLLVADPERMHQVVWNLLSNAIKFSRAHDEVTVRVGHRGSQVELVVTDTGIGIEHEFLPFAFERFRQADASTNRQFGGLGLGLAIVRHIVELHGGEVRVTSPGKGHGATFSVFLPVRALLDVEPREERSSPRNHRVEPLPLASAPKVLVVDDDPDACELLSEALGRAGATVRTATSAVEALKLVDEFQPQVLVSDVGMPVDDGYSLVRRLRSRSPERGGSIPAIALTAYTRTQDRGLALAAGFTDHMSKPVDLGKLIARIDSAVSPGTELNARVP
jgi:PAS domain S-box-containing protein